MDIRLIWVVAGSLMLGCASAYERCEKWRQPYTGADAQGEGILALWRLNDLEDSSGHGHKLSLRGAVLSADERFGKCLESFRGWPDEDKIHAAVSAGKSGLTPKGAFTLELWLKPKPELEGYPEAFLVDKKYVAHTDYQLTMGAAEGDGRRKLNLRLGFGVDSDNFVSEASHYPSNVWTHVAATYDGAGTVRFFRDGAALGCVTKPGRERIAPGKHALFIGDRVGSLYHGFPGCIAQVRLSDGAREFRPLVMQCASERRVYQRMEGASALQFRVTNVTTDNLTGAKVEFVLDGRVISSVELPELAPGAGHMLSAPFDTTLRPGDYALRATLELPSFDGHESYRNVEEVALKLVPRHAPRMPVVMWGLYGSARVQKELSRLKEIGFTHCLGFGADYGSIYKAGTPVAPDKPENVAKVGEMLDQALANNIGIVTSLSPGAWAAKSKPELRRINKAGKSNSDRPALCASLPGMAEFAYNVGASVARAYSHYPAWESALLSTELRDGANVCWHPHDLAAYKEASGLEYPEGANSKWGVQHEKLADFPQDRVIPDDHPILRFLYWYWKEGDGWNHFNSELHRGLKSAGRTDLWTFHDPAVRVASAYGSGGAADIISQWTYSYPDPLRIGVATDELFAMARGAAQPQQVMKMTQIIWYRSQTAPMAKGDEVAKAPASPWEDTDPDAAFPTIAPMHLREAFWTKLARPLRGIMYHGWGSLVPDSGEAAYRYTHPQTQYELQRLIKEVVRPLGPTLLQVPDRASDVAYLESFASQMFARRGTYGWGGNWSGDAYQMLMWAHLQPEIVYDETILKRGLEDFRVLCLMDCDVLSAGVVARIQAFQKRGGIIVGDERLCPAIKADITIESYTRTRKAQEDRAALIGRAGQLRAALDSRYNRYCDASTPDIVPRCRAYGSTDYLFAVNDSREFGDYVGQHGLVMENGLPVTATLSVARSGGHVYDLVSGCEVAAQSRDGRLEIARSFGPCEGALLMITGQPLADLRVTLPESAFCGASVECAIDVLNADGQALDAVVPLEVEILDAAGAPAEWSGYYGAAGGRLVLKLDLAPNERCGIWQVRVRELAMRRLATAYLRVRQP